MATIARDACPGDTPTRDNALCKLTADEITERWARPCITEPHIDIAVKNKTGEPTSKPPYPTATHYASTSHQLHCCFRHQQHCYGHIKSPHYTRSRCSPHRQIQILVLPTPRLGASRGETYGRIGQPLHQLIRDIMPTDPGELATAMADWWQRFSATLQRHNATMIKAAVGPDKNSKSGPTATSTSQTPSQTPMPDRSEPLYPAQQQRGPCGRGCARPSGAARKRSTI